MNGRKANLVRIQRYCIHDGPGIRTTVFFKGCPLRCKWCHNPESQEVQPSLMYNERLCTGCRLCAERCPHDVHVFEEGRHVVRFEMCEQCGICVTECPSHALSMSGYAANLDKIMEVILKDQHYYVESDGGVTFSGGEPLCQGDALGVLLDECARHRVSTYIDTSGYAPEEIFSELARKADGILFDLKLMDPRKHKEYTGVENALILANFARACRLDTDLHARVLVIPGITDDEENLQKTADFAEKCGFGGEIDLLAYHRYGRDKYRQLGRVYELDGVEPASPEMMAETKRLFETRGFSVTAD